MTVPPTNAAAAATKMFCMQVEREDAAASAAILRVVRPLLIRTKQGRSLRRELLIGAIAAWEKTVPTAGRIRSLVINKCLSPGRLSLMIQDTRFATASVSLPGDDSMRACIVVNRFEFGMDAHRTIFRGVQLATVQRHAVERYVERCPSVSDAALRSAILALADAGPDLLEQAAAHPEHRFALSVPGGQWVGTAVQTPDVMGDDIPQPMARTFLPPSLRVIA